VGASSGVVNVVPATRPDRDGSRPTFTYDPKGAVGIEPTVALLAMIDEHAARGSARAARRPDRDRRERIAPSGGRRARPRGGEARSCGPAAPPRASSAPAR